MVSKPLLGKVVLRGVMRTLTGLHIGTSKEVLEIGSVDLAVIRDAATGEPYIPGSSLKGKMRSLLERKLAGNEQNPEAFFNRNIGTQANPIRIHACEKTEDAYNCPICRVYGTSGGRDNPGANFPARIKVRDAYFPAYTRRKLLDSEAGALFAEVKYENAIDRVTAASNPRQIERVPAGTDFVFEIVYDVEDLDQLEEDLRNILFSLEAVQDDYIGGHGSRGYGKVEFYISQLAAKKADAYASGETEANTRIIRKSEDVLIDRNTDSEKSPDKFLRIAEVRDNVTEIVSFFRQS